MIFKILFIFLLGILVACEDDVRVSSEDSPKLTQSIHVIPEIYFGASYLQFAPVRYKAIDLGEPVHLVAGFSLNEETIDPDIAINYIIKATWTINKETIVNIETDYTFSNAGTYDVILSTIDYLQDTLRDTVTLLVSTPVSIEALYPTDGYNLVDPLDSLGITFSWQTQGIDSWENAYCLLYASRSALTVWSSFIDTVACDKDYTIPGPLYTEDSSVLLDSSIVFYWGVKIHISNNYSYKNQDSTVIRSFATARVGSTLSHLYVPVMHKSISFSLSPEFDVSLINSMGDTIQKQTVKETPALVQFLNVTPQSGIKVLVKEKKLYEFAAESVFVDLNPSSINVLDTLILKDLISPERWPVQTGILDGDSIRFYWMDNGSGINKTKTFVIFDGDTLDYKLDNAIISFKHSGLKSSKIQIEGKDYAGNSTSSLYWEIKRSASSEDSLYIEGPKVSSGEE